MLKKILLIIVMSFIFAAYCFGNEVFDSMESTSGWAMYRDDGVVMKLSEAEGKDNRAVEVFYDFSQGSWCGMWKSAGKDLNKYSGIQFWYRGEGASNSLELKLEDADGSNFGKILKTKSNNKEWIKVKILFSDLSYFWGGDNKFDKTNLKIHFAISVKDGDEGGVGKTIIDDIELIGGAETTETKEEETIQEEDTGVIPKVKEKILKLTDWNQYTDNGVTVNVNVNGSYIEYSYNMVEGAWCGIWSSVEKDLNGYEGIEFSYKGTGNKNTIEVKLEDPDGSNFGYYVNTKSNVEKLTTVKILFKDLSYFWGGDENLDKSNLKLHFAISKKDGDEGGSGKVIISKIALMTKSSGENKKSETAETGKDSEWDKYMDKDVNISVKPDEFEDGKGIKVSYDMWGGNWCGIWKPVEENLNNNYKGLEFTYKGTGKANSLEIKLEDGDGSNFGKVLETKTSISEWTTVRVSFSDFAYWWGGDENLDKSKIKLHFAFTVRDGDDGGKGQVFIKNIKFIEN